MILTKQFYFLYISNVPQSNEQVSRECKNSTVLSPVLPKIDIK